MPRISLKIVVIVVLVALIALVSASAAYGFKYFRENKSEIIIEVADFFETLAIPYRIAKLSSLPPDETLPIPVQGVLFTEIEDSWGALRSGGRSHKGIDIFAKRGTPIYAAASGYILRLGHSELGGNFIYTVGAGGRRYYYAHLNSFAADVKYGQPVTTETVIGYVGNTGNASTTPPHLHFGMYVPGKGALNPFGLFVSRKSR
jgi:murein DD-endopeptidase MepM/ murein hydrolase activator NlpD